MSIDNWLEKKDKVEPVGLIFEKIKDYDFDGLACWLHGDDFYLVYHHRIRQRLPEFLNKKPMSSVAQIDQSRASKEVNKKLSRWSR